MSNIELSAQELLDLLTKDAERAGYFINPDTTFALELCESLLVNERRFGYRSCPCRLSTGKIDADRDIICPCNYRDDDVSEFGACYCALYVSREISMGEKQPMPIPERRKVGVVRAISAHQLEIPKLRYPVWRCEVCGYLAARDSAPAICPICKATKDRFERFM